MNSVCHRCRQICGAGRETGDTGDGKYTHVKEEMSFETLTETQRSTTVYLILIQLSKN